MQSTADLRWRACNPEQLSAPLSHNSPHRQQRGRTPGVDSPGNSAGEPSSDEKQLVADYDEIADEFNVDLQNLWGVIDVLTRNLQAYVDELRPIMDEMSTLDD